MSSGLPLMADTPLHHNNRRYVPTNAIAPSFVRTAFSKDFWGDPERERALIARTPGGRIAEAEELVGAAILLASPAGAYISGQALLIDGARSVTRASAEGPGLHRHQHYQLPADAVTFGRKTLVAPDLTVSQPTSQ
jgi:hypothetical protein